MKRSFKSILLSTLVLVSANAADKFNNITENYLNTNASINVRTVIAQDPQTSSKVLKFLTQDSNALVRKYAKDNLK